MKESYYSFSLLRSLAYDDDVNGNRDGMIDFTVVYSISGSDVERVKHGQWLPQILLGEQVWDCSECKTLGSPHWKRCPVCEAKMDGGNM